MVQVAIEHKHAILGSILNLNFNLNLKVLGKVCCRYLGLDHMKKTQHKIIMTLLSPFVTECYGLIEGL